jgi:hypothetical protein
MDDTFDDSNNYCQKSVLCNHFNIMLYNIPQTAVPIVLSSNNTLDRNEMCTKISNNSTS